MQSAYIYSTRFPWEPDGALFSGSEESAIGMTTEVIAVPQGQIEDGEVAARYELLIIRRGDGFAFSWEVCDEDTDEIIASGEASTLADAKRSIEASAWHAAERIAGYRIQREEDWLGQTATAASAATEVAALLANVRFRRGDESGWE